MKSDEELKEKYKRFEEWWEKTEVGIKEIVKKCIIRTEEKAKQEATDEILKIINDFIKNDMNHQRLINRWDRCLEQLK